MSRFEINHLSHRFFLLLAFDRLNNRKYSILIDLIIIVIIEILFYIILIIIILNEKSSARHQLLCRTLLFGINRIHNIAVGAFFVVRLENQNCVGVRDHALSAHVRKSLTYGALVTCDIGTTQKSCHLQLAKLTRVMHGRRSSVGQIRDAMARLASLQLPQTEQKLELHTLVEIGEHISVNVGQSGAVGVGHLIVGGEQLLRLGGVVGRVVVATAQLDIVADNHGIG